ncbi:hypothetical protein LCGC14_2523070, partial [marine sediment metagenome]
MEVVMDISTVVRGPQGCGPSPAVSPWPAAARVHLWAQTSDRPVGSVARQDER